MHLPLPGDSSNTDSSPEGLRVVNAVYITSMCMVTMLLCSFAALHLNIPSPREAWGETCRRRIKWMAVILFVPEVVAIVASHQRHQAKHIMSLHNQKWGLSDPPSTSTWSKVLNCLPDLIGKLKIHRGLTKDQVTDTKAREEKELLESGQERYQWTMTHGFYAVMGGFIWHMPSPPQTEAFVPCHQPETWTITDYGLVYLLQDESRQMDIPNLSEADINSKSRPASFLKAVVCTSAAWFCIRCLTTIRRQLPISLLELNTLCNCLKALGIYLLWWDKPFDVGTGTALLGDSMLPFRALKWMTENETTESRRMKEYVKKRVPELNPNNIYAPENEFGLIAFEAKSAVAGELRKLSDDRKLDHAPTAVSRSTVLKPGEVLPGTGFKTLPNSPQRDAAQWKRYRDSIIGCDDDQSCGAPSDLIDIELDSAAVTRWRLAWRALESYTPLDSQVWEWVHKSARCIAWQAPHWPEDEGPSPDDSPGPWMPNCFPGLLYGGLHALAWNANFPTSFQRDCWRVSCCIIMAETPCIFALRDAVEFLNVRLSKTITRPLFFVSIASTICINICYFLAKAYLVIESFSSLWQMT